MNSMLKVMLLLFLFLPSFALAHPGRTDSSGCHTCRTNCSNWGLSTGEYHCHNAKALPQPSYPIKSTYGENGTGTTRLAPEYAAPKNQPQVTQAEVVDILDDITEDDEQEDVLNDVAPIQNLVEEKKQTEPTRSSFWLIRLFRLIF